MGLRARLLRPTLGDLLGLFLLVLVVLVGSRRLFGDADTAMHVATGRWILQHRQVPKTDPFPGVHAGREWFAHEWLADVGLALAHRAAGWPGVVAASALLIVASHVLLYRFLLRRGDDALVSFGAVLAAAAAASSHWLARPHLFTVLLLVLWVVILEEVVHGARRPGWLAALPVLALSWANLHGGFLVAFGVLACYLLGALATARGLMVPLTAASAASAAAVLLNPWGWRLPWHLIAFFSVRGAALRATSEFAPATIDDRAGWALAIVLGLCAAGLACAAREALRRRRDGSPASGGLHPGTLLAFALTACMSLTSIRHVEVMAIFGAIVIADGFSSALPRMLHAGLVADLARLRRYETDGGGLLLVGLVGLVTLAAFGCLPAAGFDPEQFPVRMVDELKAAGPAPAGPVFTPDVWGGYLILEWPEARVFVDGRWDMRGDAFFERYASIYRAGPGWSGALDEYGVTVALLPPDAPLAAAMRSSPRWSPWRGDGTAVVFRRRIP
jgi:hypothetical protein